MAQHVLDGAAQGAGSLAVDNRDGFEPRHDGGIEVTFGGEDGFDGLHAPKVDLLGKPRGAQRGGGSGGLGLGFYGSALDEQHLVLLGGDVHDARPQRQHPLGGDGDDLGLHPHGFDLHRVAGLDRAGGGLLLRHGLLLRTQRVPGLIEAAAQLASGLVDELGVFLLVCVPAHLVELAEGLLGGLARLVQDALGLPAGLLIGFFQPHLQLRLEESGLFGVLLGLAEFDGGLRALLFELQARLLELLDGGLKARALGADAGSRVLDDALTESKTAGDGEGVGFARNAHQQPIGGAQGLHVKLAGGVLYPRLVGGVDLELCVVGGRRDHGAAFAGVLDDGDGKRRALGGVGAGAQLVKQQERGVVALVQNAHDVRHMCRKGGEVLLNGLFIPDVRQNVAEDGQIAAVGCRNVQAALVHGCKQTDGLERHRLTAGVRAGDDQCIEALAQLHVDGHGLCLVQERMSGFSEQDALFLHGGRLTVQLVAELGLGEDEIQPGQQLKIRVNILPVLGAVGGELGKDALDLKLLLGGQLPQLVVGLDRRHGLHEQGLPRGGDVVHQPRHRALVIGPHGHHIAVGAHGDDRLLQRLGVRGRGEDLLQGVARSRGGGAHLAADGGKLRGRPVRDLVLPDDGGVDLLLQKLVGAQGIEQGVDGGLAHGIVPDVAAHQARALEHPGDVQKLPRVERAAEVGSRQGGAHVLYPGEGGAAAHGHHALGGAGLLQAAGDLKAVGRGRERKRALLCRLPHRLLRQHLQHRGQLKGV